jgi:mono/diheme cytochrome c family protein
MHETGRSYRQNGNHGDVRVGYAVLGIIAILIPLLAWSQGEAERGRPIYAQHCTGCHGVDGRRGPMANMLPVPPRNLTDHAYMQTRTEKQLFEVIKRGGDTQGLSPMMPAFGKLLSDEQIWDTVAYVRTLSGAAGTALSQPKGVVPAEPRTGDIHIQRLSVSIWPEYDDPRVLVMMRGELSPESQVPTRIRLPMPKGAELLGAGMISPQNELLNHPHERLPGDTSDTLELTLPVHKFFAEWYYDPFGQRKPARQFTYALTLPYATAQLDVDILQPDAATEFRIKPAPMRENADVRGGKHYLFSYLDLDPEAAHTFEVTYVKTTDEPSVTKSADLSSNSEPGSLQAPGLARSTKTWVTFAMIAGFAVILAGGVFVLRNKQPAPPPAAPTMPTVPDSASRVVAQGATQTPETATARPNYCSHCGRQLQVTYVFCPGCGQPLQVP